MATCAVKVFQVFPNDPKAAPVLLELPGCASVKARFGSDEAKAMMIDAVEANGWHVRAASFGVINEEDTAIVYVDRRLAVKGPRSARGRLRGGVAR